MRAMLLNLLNRVITRMVTPNRVHDVTLARVVEIYGMPQTMHDVEELTGAYYDFVQDFLKEGWCKTELRSVICTLFHLNRKIYNYAEYWF